tara:strand:- start:382 stop:1056 length:675 start_codon:yes stop_codon:yes gene_type:complete
MNNPSKGLFVVNNLHPHRHEAGRFYCRIQSCSVATSTVPGRSRLATYRVGFWKEQPTNDTEFGTIETFRDAKSGTRDFVFFLPPKSLNSNGLEKACRDHFLTKVLLGEKQPNYIEQMNRLKENADGVERYQSKTSTHFLAVSKIIHVYGLNSTDGRALEIAVNQCMYEGNVVDRVTREPLIDIDYSKGPIGFEHVYEDGPSMVEAAQRHWDRKDVRTKIISING